VLLEVQHTLHEPPAAAHSMRKAVGAGLGLSFAFYLAVGIAGYLALGSATPGDILTAFPGPAWVVDLANAAVLLHMVSAYQVFSQPVFHALECVLRERTGWGAAAPPAALRLVNRCAYVCFTTAVACVMPFFSDIISLIGALVFWPAAIYIPLKMWVKVYEPPAGAVRALGVVSAACLVVSAVALLGSVQNIIVDSQHYALLGHT
jgi:amino acid permease